MSREKKESVAVVGAGSWGTAFAAMLAGRHESVTLWAHETEVFADLRDRRENRAFLPGIALPPAIRPTNDLAEAVSGKTVVIFAVPSHHLREVAARAAAHLFPRRVPRLPGQGGGERDAEADDGGARRGVTGARPPYRGAFRPDLRPRGGGGEADGGDGGGARPLRRAPAAAGAVRFPLPPLRRRRRDGDRDRRGAEKRDGDRRGDGRRAGVRPQRAGAPHLPGARRDLPAGRPPRGEPQTFAGLAGMGDLVLTCTGDLSRNRTVGMRVGRGRGSATSSRG